MKRFSFDSANVSGPTLRKQRKDRAENWLSGMDSNHDKSLQRALCYHYTTGQTGDKLAFREFECKGKLGLCGLCVICGHEIPQSIVQRGIQPQIADELRWEELNQIFNICVNWRYLRPWNSQLILAWQLQHSAKSRI